MSTKTEVFGQFPPEPGSKDAETAFIEGHEAAEERFNPGMRDRDSEMEDDARAMEQEEHEEDIYIKRAKMNGDQRSEKELVEELHDLETRMMQYIMQHQITDREILELLDSQDAALIEFAKKEIPSLAKYIEGRRQDSPSTSVSSIYNDWSNGKDFLNK